MQSINLSRPNTNTINNVIQTYSKLRSNIDTIQNKAITDIQNSIRSKIARTKVKNVIEEKKKQSNDKRNALIKNMQNTIMTQGLINELIDTAANKGDINIKNKAATKIQDTFKNKKQLKVKLTKEKKRRLVAVEGLKERLKLEEDALTRYTDSPRRFAIMQAKIEKTLKQIEMYNKQANFIEDKIAKL